ncbi:tetratricopeptide repeat protein [Variovorax sp. J31P207]|uniref:O-linked N-acetylglucosamine transferase, SPINDLY family protein n=1 Tax=Variovorax sp. J31P207 TaxID=3053510 RepID=UPI00257845C4|nr:tetratricopeptide repeat protein [Variovorax sp. J31P207]MDM0072719.1 tetratricopeptide repeat protein [Variovorax sp. J31P207]
MNRSRIPKPHPLFSRFAAAPKPAGPDALYAQALGLYQQGRWDSAIALCRDKLLPLAPHHRDGLSLLGVACFLQDDLPASERYLMAAIVAGAEAETHTNLGITLNALHRADEAEAAYRRAVALDPRQAKAWNNLGNLLARSFQASRRDEALHCYRQALAAKPDYANAHTNLGYELENRKDLAAAERSYREALRVQPRFLPAIGNLADLLKRLKQPEEALRYYRQAIILDPHDPKFIGSALGLRRDAADWRPDGKPTAPALVASLARGRPSQLAPLYLLALPESSAELQRSAAERFARHQWAWALAQPPLVAAATPREGALRIGYLSADFRNHPVAHLVTEVITAQDRTQSEVFLYAYGPPADDAQRRALQQAADHFIDIGAMDDLDAARRIRDDGIDVLVDLTGYTTHARLAITALRPAPVIASWLGYIGSLGEPRLADYVIGDAIATPPALAQHFSETLALMPECFQPNAALHPLPPPPSRADEGLPEDALVFCSFNQIFKLTPQLWDDWCHILQAVPGSVLWLAPPGSETTAQNLREETARRGVAPERLVFARRKPLAVHQSRIVLADIALDTFPYNSGTTASDVLRAGVPLVTRAGETFVSRMAASLLNAVGLPELVAGDGVGYRRLAIALATDAPRRRGLRAALAERVAASLLFRPQRFAQQLDALLQAMHAQALAQRRDTIVLPPQI